jgi:hypothetical protein
LGGNGFHPFFFFPSLHFVLCNYVLDKLVSGFSHLFSSPWFYFCPCSGYNLVLTNSQ